MGYFFYNKHHSNVFKVVIHVYIIMSIIIIIIKNGHQQQCYVPNNKKHAIISRVSTSGTALSKERHLRKFDYVFLYLLVPEEGIVASISSIDCSSIIMFSNMYDGSCEV